MNSTEVLLKAADIVDKGWMQNRYCNDDNTRFCALGAIERAMFLGGEPWPALNHVLLREARHKCNFLVMKTTECDGLIAYNDTPGRTAAEVSALLREAAYVDLFESD